jgi:phage shock protein A
VSEPIFLRVRRVLSASAEEAVDALERAGGASILRESIRQVDRALSEVRIEQEAAAARGTLARAQQGQVRERIADLGEKARFALDKGRDDLAEAALASQLDLESELTRLDTVQADAAEQRTRLDGCLTDLAARKADMQRQLAAFEAAQEESKYRDDGSGRRDRAIRTKVDRAQETFDRVMADAGVADTGKGGTAEAEIDALRRESIVAERLAALRAKAAAAPAKRSGRR